MALLKNKRQVVCEIDKMRPPFWRGWYFWKVTIDGRYSPADVGSWTTRDVIAMAVNLDIKEIMDSYGT